MTADRPADKRILGLIGMANRAGRTASGEFSAERSVKAFRAQLVIVAEDASPNTKKLFRDKCAFYEVPYAEFSGKEELGRILGKHERASLAIEDAGFAAAILKLLGRTDIPDSNQR